MLFNTEAYAIFFIGVALLFFRWPSQYRWVILLGASYFFYMWWEPDYIILILLSTAVDYYTGLQMGRLPDQPSRKKWLYLSLLVNLGLLATFKYFNFFADNWNSLSEIMGMPTHLPYSEWLLPVGISFYTFQTLSYTIEVYRGRIKPEKHLGVFALYVAFFPQLVSGPIERAQRLLPQLKKKIGFDYKRVKSGLLLMAWGLFKKAVIGDRLAVYIEPVFDNPYDHQGWPVVIAAIFFGIRVYCDLSGYSDMAIGAARIFGVDLMINFRRPFHATSIRDFWRRWHISLSTWFRDYLYIPLGGNRVVKWRWYFNLVLVFAAVGFWHGANWTFIGFGLIHAAYILIGDMTQLTRNRLDRALGWNRLPRINMIRQIVITFLLYSFSMLICRANNITEAFYLVGQLFPLNLSQLNVPMYTQNLPDLLILLAALLIMEGVHILQSRRSVYGWLNALPFWVRWSIYILLAWMIFALGIFEERAFIYFQF